MKKLMYLFIALFLGASGLYAQDCATGYCPPTITVHHKAGDLSPIGADIIYPVVTVGSTCWLGQNLGATAAVTGTSPNSSAAIDGWAYQAGSKKGWVSTSAGLVGAPTSYTMSGSWAAANDPCTLSLGSKWHVPTQTEWVSLNGLAWASGIKWSATNEYIYGGASWSSYTNSTLVYYAVQDYWINSTQFSAAACNTNGTSVTINTIGTGAGATIGMRCTKSVSQ